MRCHGKPDEDAEDRIMSRFCDVLEESDGWGILTIGRQYYHDSTPSCGGHADPYDTCP